MKYYGKEKCRILKEIRAEIAKANDIEWVVSECKHQGNCKGTCPKCEKEVRDLEAALAKREAMGKKVAVVGISAAISLSVTGCDPLVATTNGDMGPPETQETQAIAGGMPLPETEISDGEFLVPETDTELPWKGEMIPLPGEETETETDTETDAETETETDTETDTDTQETETEVVLMGDPEW